MNTQRQESQRWAKYYQATENKPAHKTLLKAIELFERESQLPSPLSAVDLGCGVGSDTVALLQRGWRVLAIDKEPEAIRRLQERVPAEYLGNVTTIITAFEDLALPQVDLVNASYSLPFCLPHRFAALWRQIVNSIRQGGRFAGNLFGDRDTWAQNPDMTFHTRSQVLRLLEPFEIEYFDEIEEDGTTAIGSCKHWHVFSMVAKSTSSAQRENRVDHG